MEKINWLFNLPQKAIESTKEKDVSFKETTYISPLYWSDCIPLEKNGKWNLMHRNRMGLVVWLWKILCSSLMKHWARRLRSTPRLWPCIWISPSPPMQDWSSLSCQHWTHLCMSWKVRTCSGAYGRCWWGLTISSYLASATAWMPRICPQWRPGSSLWKISIFRNQFSHTSLLILLWGKNHFSENLWGTFWMVENIWEKVEFHK